MEMTAVRASSRLSTAGRKPYSMSRRSNSALLTPCSTQTRFSWLSSDAAMRILTTCLYGSQSGS